MTRASVPGWASSWNSFEWTFGLMSGIQAVCGLLFLTAAVAALRPLRGSAWPGGKPKTGWFTRIRSRFDQLVEARAAAALTRNTLLTTRKDRPSCGEDPMLWKERFTRMGGGLKWLGSRPVALFFIVLLCCYLADMSASVVVDLFSGKHRTRVWDEINLGLRMSISALAVLAVLPIGAAAASSITTEREGDTWISLATTLLTPREVIRGKQFGAVWSARWLLIGLVSILTAGLLLGAIHPIGLVAGTAILVTTAWLTAAIGVLASTLAPNSTRALFLTVIALFICGVFSTWPYQIWLTLASYRDIEYMLTGKLMTGSSLSARIVPPLGIAATIAAANSVFAALLSYWSVMRLKSTWGRS
jgi:hypothetical protein